MAILPTKSLRMNRSCAATMSPSWYSAAISGVTRPLSMYPIKS